MTTPAETVREMYGAFARGDLEGVLQTLASDVRWRTPPTLPWSRGEYDGRDGVREYFGAFMAALDQPAVEPDELLACDGTVVALGTESAVVRATGERFTTRFAHVIRVADGRIAELRGHVDTAAITAAYASN